MRYVLACAWIVLAIACGRDRSIDPQHVPASWRDVRESAGHTVHVGKNKLPCSDCHGEAFETPPLELCEKCHPNTQATVHPRDPLGKMPSLQCRDCHGFGPDLAVKPPNCMRCHAQAQGSHPAVGAHSDQKCSDCHRAHGTPSLTPRPCTDCHAERATQHAGLRGCLDCHQMHEDSLAADTGCASCHAKQPGHAKVDGRAITVGHAKCTSCHTPHQFTQKTVAACTTCHQNKPVLAATKHASCVSCHQQHEGAAPKACTTCHGNENVQHPAPGPGGGAAHACVGCHPVHRLAAGQKAVACETCHAKPHHATAKCPRLPPEAREARARGRLCANCHAKPVQSTASTGHANCITCHTKAAHRPGTPPPSCRSCHVAKVAEVRTGHAACENCHTGGSHSPRTPIVACANCHKAEAASAPTGHATCANCHQPHSGQQKPTATCASCHAEKAKAGHGTRLACASCHQPHGPKGSVQAPACVTCHDATKRPGLHRVPGHATCASCHTGHELKPKDDRASCTTCHKAQVTHEPTAIRCATCHPFGNGK